MADARRRDARLAGMSPVPPPLPYDDTLRERIRTNLARHDRRILALDERRHAAVAVVVVDSTAGEDRVDPFEPAPGSMDKIPGGAGGLDGRMFDVSGGAAFLLCRRAARLNAHASQWALPGGRLDDGETPTVAARRETDEEVGVALGPDSVLGMMDDYATRSGYVITPVVLWGGGRTDLQPHPDEVLAVYRVGLHQLLRDDSPRFVDIPESDRPVVQLPLGRDLIHAPTAAVLVQFRWLALEGRADPVADFEQPVFAWK
jgi:ADP-ribose pyrophosphatase YjhB (NUDIX family)